MKIHPSLPTTTPTSPRLTGRIRHPRCPCPQQPLFRGQVSLHLSPCADPPPKILRRCPPLPHPHDLAAMCCGFATTARPPTRAPQFPNSCSPCPRLPPGWLLLGGIVKTCCLPPPRGGGGALAFSWMPRVLGSWFFQEEVP